MAAKFENTLLLETTRDFAREELSKLERSHDWWHTVRVCRTALEIQSEEGGDRSVVELAALLHDVADHKHSGSSEEKKEQVIREWLLSAGAPPQLAGTVASIVAAVHFPGPGQGEVALSLEHAIVLDADRLDAMGAIGIARAFAYGGHTGRSLYIPGEQPNLFMDKENYRKSKSSTLNHFFEKLLLLKERMITKTGYALAQVRHERMERFLKEFLEEWG